MKLIAILIALALEKWGGHLRPRGLVRRLSTLLAAWAQQFGRSADGPFGLFLVVILPSILLGALYYGIILLSKPLAVLVGAVLLFASLGGHCLKENIEQIDAMLDLGDEEGARLLGREVLGHPVDSEGEELVREVSEGLLVEANEQLYGVLFWFILLGPTGALLFRLSGSLRRVVPQDSELIAWSLQFHWLLAWVPARVAALGYAIAGSFGHATEHWSSHWDANPDSNHATLISSGLGALLALEKDPPAGLLSEALALVTRAVAVWAAVVAILILAN